MDQILSKDHKIFLSFASERLNLYRKHEKHTNMYCIDMKYISSVSKMTNIPAPSGSQVDSYWGWWSLVHTSKTPALEYPSGEIRLHSKLNQYQVTYWVLSVTYSHTHTDRFVDWIHTTLLRNVNSMRNSKPWITHCILTTCLLVCLLKWDLDECNTGQEDPMEAQ